MKKRIARERYTFAFIAGFAILIAGVAQINGPTAFILAGLVVCTGAVLLARNEESQKERRPQPQQDFNLG